MNGFMKWCFWSLPKFWSTLSYIMKRRALAQLLAFAFLTFPGMSHATTTSLFGYSQTKILYTQNQSASLNYWTHTIKGGLELSKEESRWSYGLSGYANLSPSFTYPGTSSFLRFYGGNLRAAYAILPKKRFQLSLAAGYYFVTSVPSSYSGGFENLNGPQIYPSFRYQFKKRGLLTGYAKYSPVSSSFKLLSISSNYELAFGFGYFFKQQLFPFPIGISVDFSEIRFNASDTITSILRTGSAGLVFLF